jgi:hypothetical protein
MVENDGGRGLACALSDLLEGGRFAFRQCRGIFDFSSFPIEPAVS